MGASDTLPMPSGAGLDLRTQRHPLPSKRLRVSDLTRRLSPRMQHDDGYISLAFPWLRRRPQSTKFVETTFPRPVRVMQPIGNFDDPRSFSFLAAWPLSRIAATRKGPVVQSTVSTEGIWVIVSRTPEWGPRVAIDWVVPDFAAAPAGGRLCPSRMVADMALLGNRRRSEARFKCTEPRGKD